MSENNVSGDWLNIANRLAQRAKEMPDAVAVAQPMKYDAHGKRQYRTMTFRELDEDTDRIARGLREMGVKRSMRLALLVPQSIDAISLVFGMYKSGATIILIDPGMGVRQMLQSLSEAEPDGFVGIPKAQIIRVLLRRKFPKAKFNVTVGRKLFWRGPTLQQFRDAPHEGPEMADTSPDDPAAIIFTSGSTGPAKGVWYTHRNFDTQVEEIQSFYKIQPGGIDVPGFALFGLFNAAMGVTSVLPDMDMTRPANVDPEKYLEAIIDWNATQSFASPALWNRVSLYCEENNIDLPTLRQIVSAGAPVPAHVMDRMRRHINPEGEIHTPYGATESLPVASISASEILGETAELTAKGRGVCVGRHFPKIEWKVIRLTDDPIEHVEDVEEMATGEIGEIAVCGPVVTKKYVTRTESNAYAKMVDKQGRIWHRMGDVGYLDEHERLWVCGRKAHRVQTDQGSMFTLPCEAIFNQHPSVFRTALVGVGEPGEQLPVLIVELHEDCHNVTDEERREIISELKELGRASPLTDRIDTFLFHPAFPVDIRHNAKIFREKLTVWARDQLQ